jgi:hypothetical protein
VRQLLLDDYRRRLERWRLPDTVYPYEEALASGAAVEVSDGRMFSALHAAGLDWRPYAYGGQHWRKSFLLTERDELIELADVDR